MTGRPHRTLLAYLPAAAWAGFIAMLAGAATLPDVPAVDYADKAGHFAVYCVLGFLLGLGWTFAGRPPRIWLLLFAMVLGATDELRHANMPTRTAEFGDWLADVVGAAAGLLLASILFRRWRRGRHGAHGDDD